MTSVKLIWAAALCGWSGCAGDDTQAPCAPGDAWADPRPALTCEPPVPSGGAGAEAWALRVEWHWETDRGVAVAPIVANLTDDNGDGRVDELDVPEVVAYTQVWLDDEMSPVSWLTILDGGTGSTYRELVDAGRDVPPLVADVDTDGLPEVVRGTYTGGLRAVQGDGREDWTSTSPARYGISAADLDADGSVELLSGDWSVVSSAGSSGRELSSFDGANLHNPPPVGDIDLDGVVDLIVGEHRYTAEGDLVWSVDAGTTQQFIADVDGDPDGEVVMIGAGRMVVHDTDGSVLSDVALPGYGACAADFDGDSWIEVAAVTSPGRSLAVFELDGTALWSQPVVDETSAAGCSGFDFDGDGAYEVLYAGETSFQVFDGRTGEVRMQWSDHRSRTGREYPVVADVDRDGSAEVVLASNGGVTVLGHDGHGWPPSGPIWNTVDFTPSSIYPDGTVPRVADPSWQVTNTYRARPAVDPEAVDLTVEVVDACVNTCARNGTVSVSVQLVNTGLTHTRARVPVALYVDRGTDRELLDHLELPERIPGRYSSDSVVLSASVRDIGGDPLVVVVDDDGTGQGIQPECNEDDNEVVIPPLCP